MRRRWYTRLTNSAIAKVKPRNFSTTETSNHPSRFYQQLYQLTIVKFLRLKFFDRFKHVRFLREGSFACLFICLFVFMILIKFIEDTRKNFEAKIMDYKTKVKPNEKKKSGILKDWKKFGGDLFRQWSCIFACFSCSCFFFFFFLAYVSNDGDCCCMVQVISIICFLLLLLLSLSDAIDVFFCYIQ